jgi:hypothetical protein
MVDGEPWFILPDVCAVLDHGSPTKVAERLDTDRSTLITIEGGGRSYEINVVRESGSYGRPTALQILIPLPVVNRVLRSFDLRLHGPL